MLTYSEHNNNLFKKNKYDFYQQFLQNHLQIHMK